MRVAIYARVSTNHQETSNQLLVLRQYCESAGHTVAEVYVEEVSAGGSKHRDEFAAMMEAAGRRRFDLVLFWALDRFSREGALKTLQYLEQLDSYGVAWKSYTEQYLDSAGIFKDAIVAIISTLAKQERVRIQERVRLGLQRAKSEGKELGRPKLIMDYDAVRTMYEATQSLRKTAAHFNIGKDKVAAIVQEERSL